MDDKTFKSLTHLLSRLDNVKYNIQKNNYGYWDKHGIIYFIEKVQDAILDIIEDKPIPEEVSLLSLLLEGEELNTCNTSSTESMKASM